MIRNGTVPAMLLAETRAEVLKAVRLPAFIIPVLLFPAMFYALFGLVLTRAGSAGGMAMPAYLLGSYGTFGVIGAALFGLGVGVAAERGQGWLALKRITPMPPLVYFGAKLVMSVLIGCAIVILLAILATFFGDVRLDALTWTRLLLILSVGAVPFCAFGCALGYLTGPNSAPAVANLIYLPMSVLSGLWIPIEFLPQALQRLAPWLPPFHLARLAHGALGETDGMLASSGALLLFALLSLAFAAFAYRRDRDRTWG